MADVTRAPRQCPRAGCAGRVHQGVSTMTLQDTTGARNSNKSRFLNGKRPLCLLAFFAVSLTAFVISKAQDEETTRKLWDTAFINTGSKKPAPRKAAKRTYRVTTPTVPTEGVNGETVVGVTLWRLRRAT